MPLYITRVFLSYVKDETETISVCCLHFRPAGMMNAPWRHDVRIRNYPFRPDRGRTMWA